MRTRSDNEACGKCAHYKPTYRGKLLGWFCMNEESDCGGYPTHFNDWCEKFIARNRW